MRLRRLDLPGFGCVSGFACDLGPGLNLFYGENEAGKSTLQQAISAMLYGFFENDRALRDETARYEHFRPWGGGVYRGALSYELEDGREFEVRRDFSTADIITQLIDTALGADVSPQFGRGRHGNVPFARKHLGMSRGVFQSCAFISQGEIFELEKNASPSQIGDAIAALADSARRDVSAAKAIERLEAAMSRVGSDRARTAELPVARERLAAVTAELKASDEARQAVAEKSRRLEEMGKKARQFGETALRTEFLLHRAEGERLREQLRKLDEAEAALGEGERQREALREYAAIPPELRDEVIALRGQTERAQESLGRLEGQRAEIVGQVTDEARLEYESLRTSVGALTEEQVRLLEATAYRTAEAPARGLHGVLAALARAFGAVARFVLRRTRAEALEEPPAVSQADALALIERHRRYLTLRPLVEETQRLARQIEAEGRSAAVIEARLTSLLKAAGIDGGPTADALAAFEAAWAKRERCLAAERAADEASRRKGIILSGRTRDEMTALLEEDEAAVAETLVAHSKLENCQTNQSAEQLARALQSAREERHRSELAASALAEEVRLTLDRFRPRAEIEEELAHWQREVARLQTARAALSLAKATIGEAMTAVYRDFAPAVNSFLSEGIEAATEGRYRRAHVDPSTLRVSLLVPETDQVVTDPPVSHGTRTLLYVLMRIGLAQHMSAIGEPVPLVLDDPLVDVDWRRLPRILDFLLKLSERMQVLYFTKDQGILDWFEERARGDQHRLHIISGALAVSAM